MVALSVRMAESAPFLGESGRVGNTSTICRQCFLMMLLIWFKLLLWFVFVVVTGWMKKETWKRKIDSGSSKNVRNQLDDSWLVAKKDTNHWPGCSKCHKYLSHVFNRKSKASWKGTGNSFGYLSKSEAFPSPNGPGLSKWGQLTRGILDLLVAL